MSPGSFHVCCLYLDVVMMEEKVGSVDSVGSEENERQARLST